MNEPYRFDHKKKYVKQKVVNEDFHRLYCESLYEITLCAC